MFFYQEFCGEQLLGNLFLLLKNKKKQFFKYFFDLEAARIKSIS